MHSRKLRRTIALASESLSERIERFWTHPRLAEVYPEFLFATYGVISASTPLMAAAADEAAIRAGTDELSRILEPYLREHAEEEAGHEEWVLDDLRFCGVDRQRVLERIPYASVAAMVGAPYFWSRHVHPVAFLGYLAVLENPASPEFLERVAERSGLPLEAMSAHLRHARLDVTHVAEFDAMLDGLPLGPREIDILTTAAITSVGHLDAFFADVLERFELAHDAELAQTIFTMRLRSERRPHGTAAAASRAVV